MGRGGGGGGHSSGGGHSHRGGSHGSSHSHRSIRGSSSFGGGGSFQRPMIIMDLPITGLLIIGLITGRQGRVATGHMFIMAADV